MPRDGQITRDKILEVATELVLKQGFTATSIDKVAEASGITKGTFFYHFKNKEELSQALIEQYYDQAREHLDNTLKRAEALSKDPRQQLLITLGLFAEELGEMRPTWKGCLAASYAYQRDMLPESALATMQASMAYWQKRIAEKVQEAAEYHNVRLETSAADISLMVVGAIQGGFVMMMMNDSNDAAVSMMRQARDYVEMLLNLGAKA